MSDPDPEWQLQQAVFRLEHDGFNVQFNISYGRGNTGTGYTSSWSVSSNGQYIATPFNANGHLPGESYDQLVERSKAVCLNVLATAVFAREQMR